MKKHLHSTLIFSFLLAVFFLFCGKRAEAQCGDSIDLATWIQEGNLANGNWTVTAGGNAVNQTINGDPTFYVSPDSFINVIITGDIQVTTAADDDWIGFVFGYNDPDAGNPNNYDFYLFDWKQANQNFAGFFGNEGYALTKIDGPVVNFPQAFSAKAGPFATPIATQYGPVEGWVDFQVYSFALTYTNTRTVISINGDTVIDEYGCFPPGRFGFYNYSQSNVQYSNFTYRVAAAFEVLTPNVCIGDTAQFIALSDSCENAAGIPVNNTLTNWFWTFGDGATSNDTNASHLYTNPGTYNVSLVVTDYLGCTDTAYSTVTVYDVATDLPADTSICAGDVLTLDAGTSATSYVWSTGETTQTITISDSGQYKVTVSGGVNCFAEDSITISTIPLPIVDLGPDTNICTFQDTVILYAGNPGATFLWNTGDTLDSLVVNNSGEYIVTVSAPSGCSNSDTVNVGNFAQPTVSPPNPELCIGDTITISASGAVTYTWFPAFGLSATTGNSVQTFIQVDTTYSVIGIDTNGCTDTSDFFVDVHDLPTVNFSGGDTICENDSLELTVSLTGEAPWNIEYTIGIDTLVINGILASPFTMFVSDSGSFNPIFVSDANCSNSGGDSTFVYVQPSPVITFTSINDSVCLGDSITITASGAAIFEWTPSVGLNNTSIATVNASPPYSVQYFVEGTTLFGCSDTASFFLEIAPLPVISINATPNVICLNDTAQLTAGGTVSYFWTQVLSGDTFSGLTIEDTPQGSTNYIVEGTDAFGCSDTISTFVQVDTLPVVSINPDDTAFCLNDSALLSASGAVNYAWSPALGLSDTTTANTFAKPIVTSTYTVIGTDGNGCIGHDTVDVEIWSLPVVSITPTSQELCIFDTIGMSASGAANYAWSANYNLSAIVGDSVIANPEMDTNYIVVGTDTNGCVSNDTVSIIVHPLPNITLTTNNDSICEFDSTEITAGGAVNYIWNATASLSSTTTASVYAFPTANETFTVLGTDINGCQNTNDTSVTVIVLPAVNVQPNNGHICVGEQQELTVPTIYTYTWDQLATLTLDNNNNDTVIAAPVDTTLYTLIAVDFFGCQNTFTYELDVTPLPVTTITSPIATTCAGQRDSISITGALSYSWSPNIALIGGNTANPIMSPQVTQTYFVTATGPGNCQSIDSVTVDVFEIPDYSAGENKTICRFDTVQLNAEGGESYAWNPSTGLTDPDISDPLSFTVNTRLYTVAITDSNGCAFTSSMIVTVNPLPSANAGEDKSICFGDETRIGGQPSGPTGSTYLWTPTAGLVNSQLAPNPNVAPDTTTTYTLLVTDTNGCERRNDVVVHVNPLPVLEVTEEPNYICEGDSQLVAVTSGYASYNWRPSSAVVTPNQSFSLLYPELPAQYTVEVTDSNGCESEISFDVDVKPKPFVNAGVNHEICDGDTIELIANAAEGIYQWTPEEMVFQPDSLTTLAVPLGVAFLRLSVIDALGCTNFDNAIISAHPLPYVDAGEDIENCDMQTVFLGGPSVTSAENTIRWSPADLLSDPRAEHPWVLNTERDTFYLEVVSPDGCINYDTISVNSDCYSKIYVPNAFSPDKDGLNEVFRVYGHRIYNPHLKVYDKWGHLIFESNDLEIGWDGTHPSKGNDAAIGTYFWDFLYENERGRVMTMEGFVNLVR